MELISSIIGLAIGIITGVIAVLTYKYTKNKDERQNLLKANSQCVNHANEIEDVKASVVQLKNDFDKAEINQLPLKLQSFERRITSVEDDNEILSKHSIEIELLKNNNEILKESVEKLITKNEILNNSVIELITIMKSKKYGQQ